MRLNLVDPVDCCHVVEREDDSEQVGLSCAVVAGVENCSLNSFSPWVPIDDLVAAIQLQTLDAAIQSNVAIVESAGVRGF